MQTVSNLPIKEICSLATIPPKSIAGISWYIIQALWPWYWLLIIVGLGIWVAFEIKTRHGKVHYNSKNGFSPIFNCFVGSGTYAGLQALLYGIFKLFLGDGIYCFAWPYIIHVIIFKTTGQLLHITGFWPYIKKPRRYRRKR